MNWKLQVSQDDAPTEASVPQTGQTSGVTIVGCCDSPSSALDSSIVSSFPSVFVSTFSTWGVDKSTPISVFEPLSSPSLSSSWDSRSISSSKSAASKVILLASSTHSGKFGSSSTSSPKVAPW